MSAPSPLHDGRRRPASIAAYIEYLPASRSIICARRVPRRLPPRLSFHLHRRVASATTRKCTTSHDLAEPPSMRSQTITALPSEVQPLSTLLLSPAYYPVSPEAAKDGFSLRLAVL